MCRLMPPYVQARAYVRAGLCHRMCITRCVRTHTLQIDSSHCMLQKDLDVS